MAATVEGPAIFLAQFAGDSARLILWTPYADGSQTSDISVFGCTGAFACSILRRPRQRRAIAMRLRCAQC